MKPTKDYEIMLFKAERDFRSGKVLYDACEKLTPYATIFRYMDTGHGLIPIFDILEEAKIEALNILNFVKNKVIKISY